MNSRFKFNSIARLMRSDRAAAPRRDTRPQFSAGGGAGGGGGGDTDTADPPTAKDKVASLSKHAVEVPDPFKFDPNDAHPEKAVADATEKMRATLLSLNERGKLEKEAMEAVCVDIDRIYALANQGREIARNALMRVPDKGEVGDKIQSLSHVGRGLRLAVDAGRLHTAGEERDKDFGPAFGNFAKRGFEGEAQYALLTRTVKELGITDPATAVALRRLHALHDATVMANLARGNDPEYAARGASRTLPWYDELQQLSKRFMGALSDPTTNEGKEWVPVNILSGTVQELIELSLGVAGLFRSFPMVGPTVKWPIKKAHSIAYLIAENVADDGSTANATAIAASFNTLDALFTAQKLACLIEATPEWELDAVVNVPLYIEGEIAYAIAAGIEDAKNNGQKSGAIDGTAPAATSAQNAWDGIRKAFKLTGLSGVDAGGGAIIAEDLAAVFGAQGAFGFSPADCVWISGAAGTARLLVTKDSAGNPVALTLYQAGQSATYVTGQVAQVFGRPLVGSKFASEALDATGIVPTVADTKTAIWHVNTRAGVRGERRGVLISRSTDVFFTRDQLAYKGTWRGDFEWIYAPSATNKVVNALLNVKGF